jgi:hypothetical protein
VQTVLHVAGITDSQPAREAETGRTFGNVVPNRLMSLVQNVQASEQARAEVPET